MKSIRASSFVILAFCCSLARFTVAAEHHAGARQVTAEELRTLTAGSGEVVSTTATVCYQDPLWKFLFLTDNGHGVFVDPVPGSYELGERLRISGPIGDGHGTPIFRKDISVSRLGKTELPEPSRTNLSGWNWDDGFSDSRNSGWIELEARVEQITLIDESTRLWCRAKDETFAVTVAEEFNMPSAWEMCGSTIRVRGSLGILLDSQNLIHAPLLLTQNRSLIEVISPPKTNAYPEPVNARVNYASADENGLFRTSGKVTLASSGKIFLDDGLSARPIHVASTFETQADSFIEVMGTTDSEKNWFARVIKLRNETLEIWPTQLSISKLSNKHIGRRIQIRAFVTGYDSKDSRLLVDEAGEKAMVILRRPTGVEIKSLRRMTYGTTLDLSTAKEVDVFGVLEKFDNGVPVIVTASHDDVRVISRRWVLTPTNFLGLLAVLAALLFGVCAIVLLLRRQVSVRTQALSDLAAQLRASCDSVDAGVVAVGDDGKLLTVNETANSLLGTFLSPGDPAEHFVNCWEEKAENPSEVYGMASSFRSDQEQPASCSVSLADGKGRLRLTLTAISRKGKHIGNLWVMHDETQLQRLQAELFQAQKMEAVGTLAGGIAHDFNNLLTAILGNLQLLGISKEDAEDQHTYIEQAEAACMSAGELVQQLLGLSRKTDMKRRVVDPNQIVNNIQSLLRHGFDSNISFEFRTTLGLAPICVDPTQIEQVLLNLCVNARDAMPNGGRIILTTEAGKLRDERAIVISVADTGNGIPADIQDNIFEPFFTTKGVGEGTGLGLATSFSVISRHEGELLCNSSPGEGTTFRVFLPAANEEATFRDELAPQLETLRGSETILIVDDEWVVRTVASNLLSSGGYQTVEAKDGSSCLQLLSDAHSTIDLVLLDVTMPGMSGHETLRKIRASYPSLPVLMCSGYDLKKDGDISFEHFVPKPFTASSLFAAVRKTLDRRAPAPR